MFIITRNISKRHLPSQATTSGRRSPEQPMTSPWYVFSSYVYLSDIFSTSISLTFPLSVQGLFAMHRSWQKFDELQHEWHRKAEELADKVRLLEADAASVKTALEEKNKYKEEAESSRKATF